VGVDGELYWTSWTGPLGSRAEENWLRTLAQVVAGSMPHEAAQ